MLVRLLIALDDPAAADRLTRAASDPDLRIDLAESGPSLREALLNTGADLLLVDGARLGVDGDFGAIPAAIEGMGTSVLYYATSGGADETAAALAAGCLTVLDGRVASEQQQEALLGVVKGWRETAVQIQDAEHSLEQYKLGDFVTVSPAMASFMKIARRVADSKSSILVLGETGVGKERLASAIHAEGPRGAQPFVVVNCGAIPETLMESELFGHEKGAFTGADRAHRGYFEMAHSGTIFLDEIGELPRHLQVKLLRVIQQKEIQRVGAERATAVDVRLIAATNRDLKIEMSEDRFRPDLYYRLSVVTLTIPPLRERREDIPRLVKTYLERFRTELRGSAENVSSSAMAALQQHSWPGNVREVINVIERAVLLCEFETITLDDLPADVTAGRAGSDAAPLVAEAVAPIAALDRAWFELPLRQAKRAWSDAFEKSYLHEVLTDKSGRIADTAKHAGIDPRSLYDKMRRFQLRKEDYKVN